MPEKRIHYKGRGETTRPTCPHCGEDLKASYENRTEEGKTKLFRYGSHCVKCKYQEWN
jgi:ssDNA-binding Zn-finger/Zn-ribbon topoisomerase 1